MAKNKDTKRQKKSFGKRIMDDLQRMFNPTDDKVKRALEKAAKNKTINGKKSIRQVS